ncbi:hypothetical protein QBC40DRAFT_270777 [Triangularia verruculosa]|uniref:Actin-related protein 10 n=1 Tax=Triangularia verruculosa TaxID=2587418 RepID=A0AAN7B2B3_9PEZI|nr:hypothetical protein QBC40DRAFT_270777 [Triangularia verruculosa]
MSGLSSGTAAGTTPLPHRSVANIRSPHTSGNTNPSTPSSSSRPIPSSTFGSPSSLRADEDILILELGTRKLQIGFAGDACPRGTVWFTPSQLRRVGDFRDWSSESKSNVDWKTKKVTGEKWWSRDHELWEYDVREVDLGLIGDKVDRALREALTKYMLIDSRPRRMVGVLPSGLPLPMLSAVLDSLFSRFQPPAISLLSSPVALTVGAGVRSSLIVDLGWRETVVTSVYEFREVSTNRSVRGGRLLVEQTHKLLAKHLPENQKKKANDNAGETEDYELSFDECNDITTRMVWCKPHLSSPKAPKSSDGLPTLHEQDESGVAPVESSTDTSKTVRIPLLSCRSPTTIELPWEALAEPSENTFFDSQYTESSFDDHELPLPLLVYRSLLQLPLDVRALCMSRIIFTGGCTNVLGLRGRIFGEVSKLVEERGWDGVQGKGADQMRANPKLKGKRGSRPANSGPSGVDSPSEGASGQEQDGVWHDAANTAHDECPVEEQLKRGQDKRPRVQGKMRAIESVGAWSGASLIAHLKAAPVSTVEREAWLQYGAVGASKPSEVDQKSARQSFGPGGLMRGSAASNSWTLGVWGMN